MKEIKGLLLELLFYITIAMATVLNILDLHFINKTIGEYSLLGVGIISFMFFKRVNSMEASKKKKRMQIALPIILLISRNFFVLIGVFSMCFSIFNLYERTFYNRVMKSVYAVCVVMCFLVMVNSLILYDVYFQRSDRYEGYEYAPNNEMMITKIYVGNEQRAAGFSYNLEHIYFNVFRKFDHEVALIPGWDRHDVFWVSEEEVLINGKYYSIFEDSVRLVEITNN